MVAIKRVGFNGRPFCQNNLRGLGRHTLELILALKRERPDIDIYVYSYAPVSDFYRKQLPFVTFRDRLRQPKILWDLYFLGRDVQADKLDIFHSTNNLGVPFILKSSPRLFVTVHDTFTHTARSGLKKGLRSLWDSLNYYVEYLLLKRAEIFFTVSRTAQKDIAQKMKIPENKILIGYNGTSWPRSTGSERENFFLYVGGFEARKNLRSLLEAVISYNSVRESKIPLRLLGSSAHAPTDVQELLLSHPDLFEVKGGVSEEELLQSYLTAKAFIFPSLEEGFGLPLIEAMRSGLPVIASDIQVFREIGEASCLYFPPKDSKILVDKMKALENEILWKDLQKRGLDRSEKFTWTSLAHTVLDAYEQSPKVKIQGDL